MYNKGPIRERWITSEQRSEPAKSDRTRDVPETTATSSTVPTLERRRLSARAISCKADERMSIVFGDQTEVETRQSAVEGDDDDDEPDPASSSSIVLVPGHNLAPTPPPPSEMSVSGAAALPEERITAATDGADHPDAMFDYNLDDDDCEFLEKERAARHESINRVYLILNLIYAGFY